MTGNAWSAGLVRGWVDLYTRGLPAELRDGRRDEIAGDLWSQLEEAAVTGHSARATSSEILVRLVAGIPADITWRFEHRGDRPMTTAAPAVRASSAGAMGLGLATAIAGAGLATLLVLFYVTSQAVAPADPYDVDGPGVVLVLVGSAAELALAGALFGFAIRFGERFHRLVVGMAALGGVVSSLAALGAYTLIVLLPASTVVVAWNLASLRVMGAWLAAGHTLAAALFLWVAVTVLQSGPGSPISAIILLTIGWPLTLVLIGVAVMRGDRQPEPAPAT